MVAATNPKGKFDPSQPLTINSGIASPLLSRFDLVFVLMDNQSDNWDKLIAQFILKGKHPKGLKSSKKLWTMQRLRSYFQYCKSTLNPTMSEEASEVLSEYYKRQRRSESDCMARSTVRLLQSVIRCVDSLHLICSMLISSKF